MPHDDDNPVNGKLNVLWYDVMSKQAQSVYRWIHLTIYTAVNRVQDFYVTRTTTAINIRENQK